MRVRIKEMAKRIRSNLAYLSNVCSDKEEIVDAIFHYFARLHGIGVTCNEAEKQIVYVFVKYPYETNRVQEMENTFQYSTCMSATVVLVRPICEKDSEDTVRRLLKFVEEKLQLPHWEDYLEEKPRYNDGAGYGFRANCYTFDETLMKHDDSLDATRYGYGVPELLELGKSVVDKAIDELKATTETAKPTYHMVATRGCGRNKWLVDLLKDHPQTITWHTKADDHAHFQYCENDALATTNAYRHLLRNSIYGAFGLPVNSMPEIDKVVFNDPATIVMWKDGTKTVVKAQDGETFDPEKGLAMAICKKVMGNTRDYYIPFKKYLKQWKKENPTETEKKQRPIQPVLYTTPNGDEVVVEKTLGSFVDKHHLFMSHDSLRMGFHIYRSTNEPTLFIKSDLTCSPSRFMEIIEEIGEYFDLKV